MDDTLHVCQVHAGPCLWSVFSIVIFHKEEGFFFKKLHGWDSDPDASFDVEGLTTTEIAEARGQIIVLLGANCLGALATIISITIISLLVYLLISYLPCLDLRIGKEEEILGLDT